MKKTIILAIAAGAIVSALAIPSLVSAGKVRATITLEGADAFKTATSTEVSAGAVSFHVDADVSKASDLYLLWVANKCYADGTLVSAQYQPVHDGMATGFTVASGQDCTAYVWMFPSSETPIRGATLSFHVN